MPLTVGFDHVATLSTDLDRTVAFYRAAFVGVLTFERWRPGPIIRGWRSSTSAVVPR